MLRPPPRSTLFPYRRSSDLDGGHRRQRIAQLVGERGQKLVLAAGLVLERELGKLARGHVLQDAARHHGLAPAVSGDLARSEEHTSELQSRRDLVCRLLLEKK